MSTTLCSSITSLTTSPERNNPSLYSSSVRLEGPWVNCWSAVMEITRNVAQDGRAPPELAQSFEFQLRIPKSIAGSIIGKQGSNLKEWRQAHSPLEFFVDEEKLEDGTVGDFCEEKLLDDGTVGVLRGRGKLLDDGTVGEFSETRKIVGRRNGRGLFGVGRGKLLDDGTVGFFLYRFRRPAVPCS